MRYDLIIKDGRIVDGSGNPWYKADIMVDEGKIVKIGLTDEETKRVISAKGLMVAPGFIDAHSHTDHNTLLYREMENITRQGITTAVAGQCGSSPAPISEKNREQAQKEIDGWIPEGMELEITWSTFEEYLKEEEKKGLGANVAHLVGHGAIRGAGVGLEARNPTPDELETMKEMTAEAMEAGAYGLSSGLIYPPGIYADTGELVELSKVAAGYGGVYDSHIRGEGKTLMKALEEAIVIGEKAGIPVQISHHKVASRSLWGKSRETLEMFEKARGRGVDVTIDQYPYKAGSTGLITLLPPWAHDGGKEEALRRLQDMALREEMRKDIERGIPGWENFAGELGWGNVYVSYVKTDENKHIEGMNIVEVKECRGSEDEFTALSELLLEEEGSAGMVIFYGDEEDVRLIMKHPLHMVGTDAGSCTVEGPFSKGKPHPRHYGTYPRILGTYVRKEKVLRLEDAVRKMTSFPAQRFGILDRGLIRTGMWADIVIFNFNEISENSTYKNPHQFPSGINYVIVNGQVTIDNGKYSGILAGKTLRKR